LLVDFGQTVVCSVSDLFELQDQPAEVLEKPIASFRCRVKRFSPSKKNVNKGIRLLDENNYNVCLTLKCARDLYWAKVTLSDTDFVLYYKKPRVRKEVDEKKSVKQGKNINSASQGYSDSLELEQRKEELHEEEERLHEQEEMLRKEEENFTNESIKREQELQLVALQMQLWDISAKLDVIASNNSNLVKAVCIIQVCKEFSGEKIL
uniref:Tudor domain-containing protein n=1 Tax=Brugia timori TaxID=42155 RepID=A0A0R3QA38_9BILA